MFSPFIFCNPVQKLHLGAFFPIQHPGDHLTCYRITQQPFSTRGTHSCPK